MAEFSPKRPAEGGPPPFPPPKNNKRSSAKKASDKERDKSRINVGPAFPRWRALRAAKGLQLDSELAFLLLDAYERGSLVSAPSRRAVLPPAVSAARLSPSILEGQTDFDEDQVNSLEHCVIECESVSGETGQQREHSSDEDRAPPLHIRLGSALDKRPQLDNLPVIAAGEMVHDLPADLGPPAEKTAVPTEPHAVMREEDIVGSRAAIVYEESLRQLTALLHLPVTRCRHRMSSGLLCLGLPPFQSRVHQRRTAFVVEWVCPHGHVVWSWTSQPSLNFGMLAGDFLLGTNILLSGSDYAKVALLLRFMNMGVLSPGSFSRIQDRYCVDAVRDFWVERSAEAVQRLQGNHVVVLGSGSHDSAGRSTNYCSFSSMANSTKEVITVVTQDERRGGRSSLFMETLDRLQSQVSLGEFCTDALLGEPERRRCRAMGVRLSLDVWRGAQSLAAKIAAAAQGHDLLLGWLQDVVAHFWWCCRTADTEEQFCALWLGILQHVCGRHSWAAGRCHHEHLEDFSRKEFIQENSATHRALLHVLQDERWLRDVNKYLTFRSMADLEAFQSHVQMYASKRFMLSAKMYEARILLAALDYNFHRDRAPALSEDGKKIFKRLYRKHGRRWSLYAVRTPKTYAYIRELQKRIVGKRLSSGVGTHNARTQRPDEPRRLDPPVPAPPTEEPAEKPLGRGVALSSDILKVIVGEEEQQEWSSSLDQEDPEPPPHIKEEQEELWSSQEGKQLQGLEEADITKFRFTPVPVKSEDDEEKPQSSQLHQRPTEHMETGADGEDCGGPEPARNSDPETHLYPDTEDKTGDSSDTEVSDGDWEESREAEPGLNPQKKNEAPVDINCNVERSFSCSECGQRFGRKPHLFAHMRIHTGEKPFSCTFCGKRFSQKGNSISHMRLHTGEKPFSCSVCKKQFRYSGDVSRHMKIHTGKKNCNVSAVTDAGSELAGSLDPKSHLQTDSNDKPSEPETEVSDDDWKETRDPQSGSDDVSVCEERCNTDKESYSCSECGRAFCRRDHLMSHMRTHTGEKPFSCAVCQKRFSCSGNILAHMRIHTGEKPFECSFCDKSFSQKGTLKLHMRIHTGEKPFSCPFCAKRFAHKRRMTLHMSVHTEEKRFSCSACDKRFTWYTQLKTHKCVGESPQHRQSQTEKHAPAKELFSCTGCDKTFSLKGNLKTHMRIHTGEKPFSCSICGKGFKQNVHLTEHMTIHTGEKLYNCSVCGKGFNKKSLVKNHPCF